MKKIIFAFAVGVLAFGCKKSDSSPDQCETNNTGTIAISNNSNDTYYIYVDDVFKLSLPAKSINKSLTLEEGNGRQLYAEQVDGYTFYPTTKEASFNVVRCSEYSWQIP